MPTPPPLGRFTTAGPTPTADVPVVVIETEAVTEIVPLVDDDRPTADELVELARLERALQRAEAHARYAVIALELDAEPWYARPWAKLGVAALLGYALGRSRTVRALASLAFGAALVTSVDRALAHTAPATAGW